MAGTALSPLALQIFDRGVGNKVVFNFLRSKVDVGKFTNTNIYKNLYSQIICKYYSILNRQNTTSFDYAVEPLISDPHVASVRTQKQLNNQRRKKKPFWK